jgi:hypothetical protein
MRRIFVFGVSFSSGPNFGINLAVRDAKVLSKEES